MLSCRSLVALSFVVTLLHGVSSCVMNCTDRAYFTPSRLVVKHGDAASGTCRLCPSCQNVGFELETSVGETTTNGTRISWTVQRMTQWGTSALCYYYNKAIANQCCTRLPVTVYKLPDSVSISFANHSGQMREARQYTLRCDVRKVAPANIVSVTIYRGRTPLGRLQPLGQPAGDINNQPPEDLTFTLNVNVSKEDDGVQYWCEAALELGREGPRPPPAKASQNLTATVHYKPQRPGPPPAQITVTQGDTVQLDCTAEGNPRPSYTWNFPPATLPHSNSSVLTITSAAFGHQGHYTCSVSNDVGALDVEFDVVVKPNIVPYIAVAIAVVLVAIIAGVALWHRKNRSGRYNLKDVFRLRKPPHIAVPTVE